MLPPPPQPQPKDPATENAELLSGMPAQAFQGQNHDAHMEAHFSLMYSSVVKGNPMLMANVQGHIMQHISLKAQEQVQAEMAPQMQQMQQMQPQQQQMMQQQQQQMMQEMQKKVADIEQELISEFIAEYEQLLKDSASDPLVELKKDELGLREKEMIRKGKEANEKLGLEKKKLDTNTKVDREKIDQQKDAVAIRSAIAVDKLEKDSVNRVMDKAEKITANMEKTVSAAMKPNGRDK